MKEHFGFTRGFWARMAVWGSCLAALCLCNASCIMVQPVGGTATVEAYQWTGHNALICGADQRLPDLAKALSTQPSREGELTELSRVIVIPFYEQDKMPEKEGSLAKVMYELFQPVVLTGSEKQFDYPKRSFVRIMINPMYGIPMDSPPEPGALVFAEGCWPLYGSLLHGGGGAAHFQDTRVFKPRKATLVFNVIFYDYADDDPPQAAFVLRPVHYPQTRPFDFAVAACAGCDGDPRELVAILDKYPDRLFSLIDKSPALAPEDRLMIYQQLTQLTEGAMELDSSAKYPTYRDVLKKVLPILRAKSR